MAASSGAIRAGRAFVELLTDDSKLVRGLRSASAKLKGWGASISGFGKKLAGIGMAGVGAGVAAAKVYADMGSRLVDLSQRTGMSVEALSTLGYAADQSGADLEALEVGVRKMQNTITDAATGSASAQKALSALGLSAAQMQRLNPEQQFMMLAEQLSKVADPTRRAALAMDIFGRSGTNLLPMMADGANGIARMQTEARRLGLQMSGEDAQAAESFGDALSSLWATVRMGIFHIGAALAPVIRKFVEHAKSAFAAISQWITQNRGLVSTVLWIAGGALAAGAAIYAFGIAVKVLSIGLGVLATVVSIVTITIKVLAAVVAFLCSPIGLVVAAVVGLGLVFLQVTGMLGKLANWLGDCWNTLKDDALTAFGAIGDFLASGNIAGAAEVLWTLLKLEWARGTGWISVTWTKAMNFLVKVFTEAWSGLRIIAAVVTNALANGWDWMVTGMAQAFSWLMAKVKQGWEWLKNGAANTWTWIRNKVGNISDEEAQASYRANNAARERAINSINDEASAEMASRENARQARQADRDREYNDTVGGIVREQQAREQALDAEVEAKEKAAQAEVDAAKKRLAELAEQAKTERAASDRKSRSPEDIAAELKKVAGGAGAPGGLADAINQNKASARGIFNAEAILSLQAQGPLQRIAIACENTARNTKRMVEQNTDPHFGGSPGAGG
ncbi:MAG: hypothetical protein BIFFINMI_00627 [Phycisphaerae bacterium]|nr:hypothetical protein [Phycisphaerae bacterium]